MLSKPVSPGKIGDCQLAVRIPMVEIVCKVTESIFVTVIHSLASDMRLSQSLKRRNFWGYHIAYLWDSGVLCRFVVTDMLSLTGSKKQVCIQYSTCNIQHSLFNIQYLKYTFMKNLPHVNAKLYYLPIRVYQRYGPGLENQCRHFHSILPGKNIRQDHGTTTGPAFAGCCTVEPNASVELGCYELLGRIVLK